MEVWGGTLIEALRIAILSQRERERARGYTSDSAMVASWQEILDAVQDGRGDEIFLKDSVRSSSA
jgi:hypothetical protein